MPSRSDSPSTSRRPSKCIGRSGSWSPTRQQLAGLNALIDHLPGLGLIRVRSERGTGDQHDDRPGADRSGARGGTGRGAVAAADRGLVEQDVSRDPFPISGLGRAGRTVGNATQVALFFQAVYGMDDLPTLPPNLPRIGELHCPSLRRQGRSRTGKVGDFILTQATASTCPAEITGRLKFAMRRYRQLALRAEPSHEPHSCRDAR